MIPLDRIDAFIAFAERRSFTHAARDLHLSQPALFAQIQKLEEHLGVSVYRREGRTLHLTPEGERLLGFARELRERVTAFEADLRGESTDTPVTLVAGRGSYLYLLGPGLRRFQRGRWPLRALVGSRDACVEAVKIGRAHVGVTAALGPAPEGLVVRSLHEVSSMLAFPAGHRFERRRRLRLADLDGEPLVAPPSGRGQRTWIERALRDAGVSPTVAVEADGWDLLLHMVSLGLGVAIVNDSCRLPRGVKARPFTGLPSTEYVLLARPDVVHPGARALIEALTGEKEATARVSR